MVRGARMQRPTERAGDPDAAPLRRVGWQLAALTVGLLAALLCALGGGIYLTVQHALYQSLQDDVHGRAGITVTSIETPRGRYFIPLPPPGSHLTSPPGSPCGFLYRRDNGTTFVALANKNLVVICDTGRSGSSTLPDPMAARQALQGRLASPYSTRDVGGERDLIYTTLARPFAGGAVEVVQVYLSERQYLSSLHSLLQVLIAVSGLGLLASAAISALLVRRALRPIQLAMRRQRDFVADAAHELRTPLAIMRTAAELGLAAGTVGDQETALEQTLVQNAHLARLVDSLSLLARADSGALTIERQPVDLARLATEAASGVDILAEDRDVRLCVEAPERTCVLGDAGRLRQLLLILLDNALKYTAQGGTITVRVERGGGRARLQVQDSGPGIDPHDLPHLFDRFYRADRARSGDGMGLGLAIGRWIAEVHGGSITAANAPSHGALFTVTLPLAS